MSYDWPKVAVGSHWLVICHVGYPAFPRSACEVTNERWELYVINPGS